MSNQRATINHDLTEIILSEEQIAQKVREAAAWLDERFKKESVPPLAVGVLKGCVFFSAIWCAPCRLPYRSNL